MEGLTILSGYLPVRRADARTYSNFMFLLRAVEAGGVNVQHWARLLSELTTEIIDDMPPEWKHQAHEWGFAPLPAYLMGFPVAAFIATVKKREAAFNLAVDKRLGRN